MQTRRPINTYQDFELIPRKGIGYRGHVVEKMDIEAILHRGPDLVGKDDK